ncbi:uncharacterized protein LOC127777589 [Oryza glaberrima]|uniref:Phorbol-ester/DAG-type domain-containing protein n=1 Tax=Oryza barthii TaxID=65489 RepID=A0A0D3HBU0_9ORYZ|nr:uncharacterized protein LOC127777589 [Oryza glaberrima]
MGNSNSGPQCERCKRSMDQEDFTNSTCRVSACDICHLLVAGTMGYSCSSCRYKVHKVCPVPLDNVNVQVQQQTQGQQQHLGFGTQLGMNAANGFAGGVGNALARESIHHVTNYAVRSISSHHHRDGQPPENAASVAETIAYNHAETGGSTFDAFDF